MSRQDETVSIQPRDDRVAGVAQARRTRSDCVEHRLNIRRRAGNDAQDLTRRCLLFQGLFELIEQPDVLKSDDRLVSEGFEEFDLRRIEWRQLYSARSEMSYNFPSLAKRSVQDCTPVTAKIRQTNFGLIVDIRYMQCPVFAHPMEIRLINSDLNASDGNGAKMSAESHHVFFAQSQNDIINTTNPRRALDDGVEDWLHVRRRAADDAENLGRLRLMLQSFSQFRVAVLQFFEQPHVLDSDDGLVGEGLKKRYLLVCKRTSLHAANQDRSKRNSLAEHRNSESRPGVASTSSTCSIDIRKIGFGFSIDVLDMSCLTVNDGTTSRCATSE